eukprot:scaffold164929_cov59-Attheya_sp.AAC.2
MVARSNRPSLGSRRSRSRALLCMSLLLVIGTRMVHVAEACRCMEELDPCAAMWDRTVLVRGTVGNETAVDKDGFPISDIVTSHEDLQFISYSYDVILETVFVNANGLSNLVEGQTIQVRVEAAGNSCDIRSLTTGYDMLLDLDHQSNGEYFSTNLCAMNSPFDEKNFYYNKCFSSSSINSDRLILKPKQETTTSSTTNKEEKEETNNKVGRRNVRGRGSSHPDQNRVRSKRTVSDFCDGCALLAGIKDDVEVDVVPMQYLNKCPLEEPVEDQSCSNPGLKCDYTDAPLDKDTTCYNTHGVASEWESVNESWDVGGGGGGVAY